MFVFEGVCLGRFRFHLMVLVVFNFGRLWSGYFSRLSRLVACSSLAISNFASMIVNFHLEGELIFGWLKLVLTRWKLILVKDRFCSAKMDFVLGETNFGSA